MDRRRVTLALVLLSPFMLIVLALQLAALAFGVGVVNLAWAAQANSPEALHRGTTAMSTATRTFDLAWSSPGSWLLETNPLSFGVVDEIRAAADTAGAAAQAFPALGKLAVAATGMDGRARLLEGSTVSIDRLIELERPLGELATATADVRDELAAMPRTGILGRPLGGLADELGATVGDVATVTAAAALMAPDLPEAMGALGPRRYLICALNDAEVFASGGAPLSAVLVEADNGRISVPISGQMATELSPNNPPITWEYVGGPPWYRDDRKYPFVNSNFHPDFRTASQDIRRAWAALDYPAVDGVITIDVAGLASILRHTGPVQTIGYGEVGADSIVQLVLVDAYREFDSPEGVLRRHAKNAELTDQISGLLGRPSSAPGLLRGMLEAIPGRHIQAAFATPGLQAAVDSVGAAGALADGTGSDLVGVWSQSAPNKLSVFQERTITQDVTLDVLGGAEVKRTVTFTNAVPEDLEGWPTVWRGYTALRARMRVAYRMPATATDARISIETVRPDPGARLADSTPIPSSVGPYPDGRGGQVLWQGHETAPRATTTATATYTLPAGSFGGVTGPRYRVAADPQALVIPTTLVVRVAMADGSEIPLPDAPGWERRDGAVVWSGTLDRQLSLVVP